MPKQVLELKLFNEGIVSHPDPEDININGATYSKNLDSIAKNGTLMPKQYHVDKYTFGDAITTVKIAPDYEVQLDGKLKYNLVFFQPAQGFNGQIEQEARIGFFEDFYEMLEENQ